MNSNQIASLYQKAGIAPSISQAPPATTNVNYGGTLTVPTVAIGSSPLSYQWYNYPANTPVSGQTTATLVISNFTVDASYYLLVSNTFGFTNTDPVSVHAVSGQPQIVTDVFSPFYGVEGKSAANSVDAYGTAPLAFQWQFWNGIGWVNLADNSRISGSQTRALAIANLYSRDAGYYQVVVTNASGSATSSVATLVVATLPLNFYTNGLFWKSNGTARIADGVLTLTDPAVGGNGSFFFPTPQYVGAFQAEFTYQAGGDKAADGVTFCLQNDPRGASATGGGGGQLGVSGITPSLELELDIFANPKGYAVQTNGITGLYTAPGSVQLNSGDPIDITVTYLDGLMDPTFTDAVANTSYSTTLDVGDITPILGGNTALVGFTGSFGGSTSIQTISNFSFVSLALQAIQLNNGTNGTISWPGPLAGYALEQNSDLNTSNWVNVTNQDNVVNGQHQVVVLPATHGSTFSPPATAIIVLSMVQPCNLGSRWIARGDDSAQSRRGPLTRQAHAQCIERANASGTK